MDAKSLEQVVYYAERYAHYKRKEDALKEDGACLDGKCQLDISYRKAMNCRIIQETNLEAAIRVAAEQ